MQTTIPQRAFDINTMEIGSGVEDPKGEIEFERKRVFLTPFHWNAAQPKPVHQI